MRQGDPKSVSVYPDYVPQIKAASGRRSSSSSKSSAAPAEKAKGRKKK